MRTFEGYSRYKISHLGFVYDLKLKRYLKEWTTPDGYVKVMLHKDSGERVSWHVGRLVGFCYVANPHSKPEVNHKDGIKRNNSLNNIEWVTHAENIQHAWDNGLLTNSEERVTKIQNQIKKLLGSNHKARAVICVTTGEEFDNITEPSRKYNIAIGGISACCSGFNGRKSAGKHPQTGEKLIWKYKEK